MKVAMFYWTVGGGGIAGLFLLVLFGRLLRRPTARLPAALPGGVDHGQALLPRGAAACQETLELARQASQLASTRPEAVLAVLRFWLAASSASEAVARQAPNAAEALPSDRAAREDVHPVAAR
jgi:hypothetical protein